MFKNILGFYKGKHFLTQVLEEFKDMLDNAECMYKLVCGTLLDNVQQPDLKDKIHEIDKKVNSLEKHIRGRIVEHLVLQPEVDVAACLVLMSVVKDAERLGDYAKNLYEVTELLEKPIDRTVFSQYFNDIDKDIVILFEQTKHAFVQADASEAESSWDYEKRIAKGCDRIIEQVAMSDLSVNEAVCFTLIARHFKRVVAHLVNIATSMILPLSDLDYYDEKRTAE